MLVAMPTAIALAAVDQQVREPRRQHDRLDVVARVVVVEVDGVLGDPVEHPHRQLGQPRFGVVVDEATGEERVVVGDDPHRVHLGRLVVHRREVTVSNR